MVLNAESENFPLFTTRKLKYGKWKLGKFGPYVMDIFAKIRKIERAESEHFLGYTPRKVITFHVWQCRKCSLSKFGNRKWELSVFSYMERDLSCNFFVQLYIYKSIMYVKCLISTYTAGLMNFVYVEKHRVINGSFSQVLPFKRGKLIDFCKYLQDIFAKFKKILGC